MSRTYRNISPRNEFLKDTWYKHQEERRLGKGVWVRSMIKSQHSSNRVKARMAAKQGHGLVEVHNEAQQ